RRGETAAATRSGPPCPAGETPRACGLAFDLMKTRRQGVPAIHPSEGGRGWSGDRDAGTSRRVQWSAGFDNSRLGGCAGRARLRRRLTWPIPSSRREPHAARPRTLCRPVNILLRSGAPASNGPVRPRSLARSIVSLEGSSTLPSWAEVTPLPLPILFRRTPRSPHAGSDPLREAPARHSGDAALERPDRGPAASFAVPTGTP